MPREKKQPTPGTIIDQLVKLPIEDKLEVAKELAKMIAEDEKETENEIEAMQAKLDLIRGKQS